MFSHHRQQTVTSAVGHTRWAIANNQLKFSRQHTEWRVVPFKFTEATQLRVTNLNVWNFESRERFIHARAPRRKMFQRARLDSATTRQQPNQDRSQTATAFEDWPFSLRRLLRDFFEIVELRCESFVAPAGN